MKNKRATLACAMAILGCAALGAAHAQTKEGHWTQGVGGPVWKSSTGLCWKLNSWTPSMAIEECDPDLMQRQIPPPPALAPKPAATPAAKPAPAKPLVLTSTVIFAEGKATLDEMAKFRLDMDIINKLGAVGAISYVNVNGHTDRLGAPQYNQKLSERRAAAVKAYLVSKGVNASQIEIHGFGKAQPKQNCPDLKDRKKLVACLEPNRRVEVELRGNPK